MLEPRPLSPQGRWQRVAPFAAAAVLSAASLLLPTDERSTGFAVAGGVWILVTCVAAVALPWHRWPAYLDATPALMFLVAIALLRHAEGGAASGFGPLVIFPVLWIALYGTRRQLLACGVGVAALFLIPAAFFDPTMYPDGEWRRGMLWIVATAIMGPTVQRLVGDVRHRANDLERIADTTRLVARAEEPKVAVCDALRAVLDADFVVLMEPVAARRLVATAAAGIPLPDVEVPFDHPTSGTAQAFRSRDRLFATEAESRLLSSAFTQSSQVRSALFEPVRDADAEAVIAIAVAGFRVQRQVIEPARFTAVEILTGEAAVAIARARHMADLAAEAATDPLTGCANRRFWVEYLPGALAQAAREHRPVAVAMIDIDHFKRLNDTRGHQAGDQLLVAATKAWRQQLRAGDVLARYGGEEFSVCLPNADAEHATATADRLRHGVPNGSTCSIGVAVWDTTESPDALVERADAALYQAKRSGRDRTVLA